MASSPGPRVSPTSGLPTYRGIAENALKPCDSEDPDIQVSRILALGLSVAKAASKTALSLSAGTVTYGKETSEKITVTASPQYAGTPGGTVTVKAGGTALATLTLKSGKAAFTLTATRLKAGTYKLTAVYGGSEDYSGSTSPAKTLTVKK